MQRRNFISAVLLAAAGTLVACTGMTSQTAQERGMPPDIAAKVAAFGRVIAPPKTIPIYAPLQEKEPYKGIHVVRDVNYGPAAQNLLDVFSADNGANRPVLVFVHGGGFVAGSKHRPGTPFYDNILVWAVRNNMVGVNMTYRLAPAAPWPAGAEDVSKAIRWVAANIAAYGGDPGRIYVMGHSAGATHVADYVANTTLHLRGGLPITGAILLSGVYDLTTFEAKAALKPYFGSDTARYAQRSPIHGLLTSPVPLLFTIAELDPVPFERQGQQLNDALCKSKRGCQTFVTLPKHNHLTEAQSINTADTSLTRHLLAFIK